MDWIIVPLVLIFGFTLKFRYKLFNGKDHNLLDALFLYHMFMSFVFFLYTSFNHADARTYWKIPKLITFSDITNAISSDSSSASDYLYLLNYLPSNTLDLSYFSGTMIYGVLGYWGVVFLLATLKHINPLLGHLHNMKALNIPIYPTVLFLPNFHFWSSSIGKDTILFLCVSASIYALITIRKNWYIFIPTILLSFFIRPHILLFFVSGFGLSFIIKSKLMAFQKVGLILFGLILFLPLLSSVLEFTKIEDASIESYTKFSQSKATSLSKGNVGSSVDLASLPYPLQVFTFLFRPLFFDAKNVLGLLASVESFVWLILSVNFFTNKPLRTFKQSSMVVLGAFSFWLIGALAFAPSMGNLGIIVRQRNMFLPAFIVFAIAGLSQTSRFRKFTYYYNFQKKKFFEDKKSKRNVPPKF